MLLRYFQSLLKKNVFVILVLMLLFFIKKFKVFLTHYQANSVISYIALRLHRGNNRWRVRFAVFAVSPLPMQHCLYYTTCSYQSEC